MPTADIAAVVLVFDWLETEYCDWKSPTEARPFEVEYYCPLQQMVDHLYENLMKRGYEQVEVEGPLVNCAVAVTVHLDTQADVECAIRDVNETIPWKHGPRGEVCKETQNES